MGLTGRISSVRLGGNTTVNKIGLTGRISSVQLDGNITVNKGDLFDGKLDNQINYSVTNIVDADPYTGSYTFIPSVYNDITALTKEKYLSDDITFKKVPQYEVSNPSGGLTLTIGD